MGSTIIGCGKCLPALEVENDELKALVDTNDEWISTRTGIKSRRVAVDETNSDLAEVAARQALGWIDGGHAERRLDPGEIDLVICATITPDVVSPSEAGLLRRRLGLSNAIAFDLNAACSGFVYGLAMAESMMAAAAPSVAGAAGRNPVRRALVVGAERLTRLTDWSDRNTCVLFGDGAGAAVLEWSEERPGILSSFITNEDDEANALTCAAAYEAPQPFDAHGISLDAAAAGDPGLAHVDEELAIGEAVADGKPRQVLRMNGPKVFKFASEAMTAAIRAALDRANLSLDDVACIVPHQANERIIKYAAKKLGCPLDLFQLSIAHTGNSSAASVPMALADAYESGRIQRGDNARPRGSARPGARTQAQPPRRKLQKLPAVPPPSPRNGAGRPRLRAGVTRGKGRAPPCSRIAPFVGGRGASRKFPNHPFSAAVPRPPPAAPTPPPGPVAAAAEGPSRGSPPAARARCPARGGPAPPGFASTPLPTPRPGAGEAAPARPRCRPPTPPLSAPLRSRRAGAGAGAHPPPWRGRGGAREPLPGSVSPPAAAAAGADLRFVR